MPSRTADCTLVLVANAGMPGNGMPMRCLLAMARLASRGPLYSHGSIDMF